MRQVLPGLADSLAELLGGAQVDGTRLGSFLPEWEKDFMEAPAGTRFTRSFLPPAWHTINNRSRPCWQVNPPQSVLWPLVHTWTLSAAALPQPQQLKWHAACETLGLTGENFNDRLEGLDHFLDVVEETLENMAASQGL